MAEAEQIALCETPILDAIVIYFGAFLMCGVVVYLIGLTVWTIIQIIRPTERLEIPLPSSPYGGYRRG